MQFLLFFVLFVFILVNMLIRYIQSNIYLGQIWSQTLCKQIRVYLLQYTLNSLPAPFFEKSRLALQALPVHIFVPWYQYTKLLYNVRKSPWPCSSNTYCHVMIKWVLSYNTVRKEMNCSVVQFHELMRGLTRFPRYIYFYLEKGKVGVRYYKLLYTVCCMCK